jgi:glycosyltransferase involved in cell wall biosynthesis
MRTEHGTGLGQVPLTDAAAGRAAASARPAVGLVSPLPPQVGGVASFAEWLLAQEAEIGCRFVTFDLERPPGAPAGGKLGAREAFRQASLALRFARWVRRAPRIVHVCVSYTTTGLIRDLAYVALLRAAGRRVIAHVHGGSLFAGDASVRARLVRLVSRLATATVTIGPSSAAALASLGVEAEWVMNPVRVAPGGGTPPEPSSEALRVLFAGTYGQRKGTPDLLRAVRRTLDAGVRVELVLAGKEEYGGEEAELRSLASELELNGAVKFAGVVGRQRLAELYTEADAFCLPSERDGVPMALLEAMAAALPVVATRVGGIGDLVVDGETGVLVEPGDPGAVADALAALARSADLRRRLGDAGRARVETLAAPPVLVARWREVYRRQGLELERES